MESFNEVVMEFNSFVHQQKLMEALDKFYHPDIISSDNEKTPVVGIENLKMEVKRFMEEATVHKIELVSVMIEKNLSVTNWYYAFDHKRMGSIDHHQLSVQRWKDNKIIQEHHLYVL